MDQGISCLHHQRCSQLHAAYSYAHSPYLVGSADGERVFKIRQMAAPKSPTPSAKLPPLLISRDSYTQHGNTSEYTLATVRKISDGREYDDDVNVQSPSGTSPTTPLLSPGGSHATGFRSSLSSTTRNRRIINAALKMATVFLVSTAIMAGILWLALPKLDKFVRPIIEACIRLIAVIQTR